MKLIDPDALAKHIKDLPTWWADDGGVYPGGSMKYPDGMYYPEDIISSIDNAPAVDAEQVVRCKDCAFYIYEGVGSSTLKRFGRCAKWYPFGYKQHSCHNDDFCSYGERREGE